MLKEKWKLIKVELRSWNKEVVGQLDCKINRKKIENLDRHDDTLGLEEKEIINRNRLIG